MTTTVAPPVCARCGQLLAAGDLACPRCGLFVHVERLKQLTAEAQQWESIDPQMAASIWRSALGLVPADSPPYQTLLQRIAALEGNAPLPPLRAPGRPNAPRRRDDPLGLAVMKTLGSMALSVVVYGIVFDSWSFALAFVLLMLVHEMGHVLANVYYKLSASPPIFIPFIGAVINLRQAPPNAKVEAIVGIGGPVLGTIGALGCYLLYLYFRQPVLLEAAYWGFFLNLFNLLPVPPLDGGRVTAAVSPWIWMLGLLAMLFLLIVRFNFILLLVIFYAMPRIWNTLRHRDRMGDYYNISRRSSWTIGAVYAGLGITLLLMRYYAGTQLIALHML